MILATRIQYNQEQRAALVRTQCRTVEVRKQPGTEMPLRGPWWGQP